MNQEQPIGSDQQGLVSARRRSAARWELKSRVALTALVYPIDASFSEDTKCQIAEKLELAIAHHLGCLEVTTPTAIPGFESRNNDNRRPWCYLLCDISGKNLQTLLADGFIANQHASLHIIPFDPPPSHYIRRICNFTFLPRLRSSVNKVIRDTLSENLTIKTLLDTILVTHNDLVPRTVLQQGYAREWIIGSARAFHIQSEKQPSKAFSHWNWYIQSPTKNLTQVNKWKTALAALNFDALRFGVGSTIANLVCTRCKLTNHNKVECPFTELPFVPAPPNDRPPTTTNRGRGGKRGNPRGTGRGRA